jgi:hypothetical protein
MRVCGKSTVVLLLSGTLICLTTIEMPAIADSKPAEWLKYFNPMPQKNYLNQSQDRVIKKKSFKTGSMPDSQPIPNKEIGLFGAVSVSQCKDTDLLKGLLANDKVSGLSTLISWKELEPTEGQYDWKLIDNLLDVCKENNKSLILRISTCGLDDAADENESDTPKWVFAAGAKSISYQGADGKPHLMPIFWDPTYLAKWANFVKTLGEKYDKNPSIHSIGITGGGILGSTTVIPDFVHDKTNYDKLEETLKTENKMTQRQLVEHWKYVADLFPKSFQTTRLNFDIDPPTPNRAGQDTLDEISDYLVYRYGQRIYLTRQNISDTKHGFDQYRIILKFKNDTFTGYALTDKVADDEWPKLTKNCLDDGVSFVELPAKTFANSNETVQDSLAKLNEHLGYQLVSQKVTIPSDIKSGESLKASFSFLNLGSAAPKRPNRQLDRDIPASYQIGLELRDNAGKAVVLSVQTPPVPTTQWLAGKPIAWEDEFRMPKLKAGEYSVWLSVLNKETKKKLQILNALDADAAKPEAAVAVGKIQVLAD